MAKLSKRSKEKLETCDFRLQAVCNLAIQAYDFSVVFGQRTQQEQLKLYEAGRQKNLNGTYSIIDQSKVVTYCDGFSRMSTHNYSPSLGIDLIPYPTKWTNEKEFFRMAGAMFMAAELLGIELEWGGDWTSIKDLAHFQVKKVGRKNNIGNQYS